eukprot:168939-Amphidinium_carterae.1
MFTYLKSYWRNFDKNETAVRELCNEDQAMVAVAEPLELTDLPEQHVRPHRHIGKDLETKFNAASKSRVR